MVDLAAREVTAVHDADDELLAPEVTSTAAVSPDGQRPPSAANSSSAGRRYRTGEVLRRSWPEEDDLLDGRLDRRRRQAS